MEDKIDGIETVKNLLPPPYETNCKDYVTEWRNRGGEGPTTEEECMEECRLNASMKIYGCVYGNYRGGTNERRCSKVTTIGSDAMLESDKCIAENCRPACYEITYEVKKRRMKFDIYKKCDDPLRIRSLSYDIVRIMMDGMQTTVYTYSPKFENIEIFSYIGGYIGIWLGISLIAVFDFLESLVFILRYPFRQILQKRDKKQRVMPFQRTI